jgi:serine/threonine protein kinase
LNSETGEVVAIKRVELQGIPEKELASLEGELNLLQKLNHPNIVQYVGCIRSDKHLNIVLEFMENGSLFTILKKFGTFPETLTSVYIVQVLQGLDYLHKEGVIHRFDSLLAAALGQQRPSHRLPVPRSQRYQGW